MPVKLVHPREAPELIKQFAHPDLHNYCELLGLVHHVLAMPERPVHFPDAPRHTLDEHTDAIRYWEAAWYMLTCLCGWSNAGRGLEWFYKNGKQDHGDLRLRILKEIWDSQGHLALLAAWLWKHASHEDLSGVMKKEMSACREYRWTSTDIEPDATWWRSFETRFREDKDFFPGPYSFTGGSNELHMGHFFQLIPAGDEPGILLKSNATERRAALILDRFSGWYGQLVKHGDTLPSLGERSWHVDVFVRTMGWLGSFRRSRETGLWFQGKHSIHIVGQ